MAVFTAIDDDALRAWLAACSAGALNEWRPTDGGVDNSNWFVQTDIGQFVLTLFESRTHDEAERTLALTARLADAGLPVAAPWPQHAGWTASLAGRPAALSAWIDGAHPVAPTRAQCAAIGGFLGRMHRITMTDATTGIIHSDLFRDNALFDGDILNGVIDFHFAREGAFIEDVAVAALDWCWGGAGIDLARLAALGHSYAEIRPVAVAERDAFPAALSDAANRFLQSRLADPRATKDPEEMRVRVDALAAYAPTFPQAGAACA
ncbi:MAG: phosphotransferase [Gammaproteobacteria bacterium]